MPNVVFTRDTLKLFKRAYNNATRRGHESFIFEGNEYLVGYAKYLIEYLEATLKSP